MYVPLHESGGQRHPSAVARMSAPGGREWLRRDRCGVRSGSIVPEPFVPALAEQPAAETAAQVGKAMAKIWSTPPA